MNPAGTSIPGVDSTGCWCSNETALQKRVPCLSGTKFGKRLFPGGARVVRGLENNFSGRAGLRRPTEYGVRTKSGLIAITFGEFYEYPSNFRSQRIRKAWDSNGRAAARNLLDPVRAARQEQAIELAPSGGSRAPVRAAVPPSPTC